MSTYKDLAVKSAQTVTAIRAVANKEKDHGIQCHDYLAKDFLESKYKLITRLVPQPLLKNVIDFISPGSYGFIITRTRLFDKILEQEINHGIRQVVILGAGYDSRAFRFADSLKSIKVFEMDFPGTQLYKRKKLATIFKNVPGNITFIPIDFNEKPFDETLLQHGFSPDLKTLFLWEGVSYYLPQAVVEKVLGFVSNCAMGSSILFDYATKDFINGDHTSYGGKQLAKWLKKINEPFLFGMNASDTPAFIEKCSLNLMADFGPTDLEVLYLLNMKGKRTGKTLGHVRMAHAKV